MVFECSHYLMERGNPCVHTGSLMTKLPVSIWWSPYGNGDRHTYGSQNDRLPVSIRVSPYRNSSPFPNGDGSVTNPFLNRVCAHFRIEVKITIWECFPYRDLRFYMGITVREWAGRLRYSHMGNPRFRTEFVSIWGLTYIFIVFRHLLMQWMVLLTSQKHRGGLSAMEDKGQQWR